MNRAFGVIFCTMIVVTLVGTVVYFNTAPQRSPAPAVSSNVSVPVSAPSGTVVTPSGVSASELAVHNTRDDCWVGFEGKVYDLSAWLPRHPGSASAIAPFCGTSTEFENALRDQHGGSQDGRLVREGVYKGDLQ